VCAHVGGPKIVTPYMCYRTKFRRSRSNRLGIGRGPKKFRDAGAPPFSDGGVADPRNTPLSHLRYRTIYYRCRSNRLGVRVPKLWRLGFLEKRAWFTHRTLLSQIYHRSKFCRRRSNRFGEVGVPKIWRTLGSRPLWYGHGWPIEIWLSVALGFVKPFLRTYRH